MSAARSSVVVLKFGSSVLTGVPGFRRAAEQIHAEITSGRKVCAVVSATPGTTDRLWREAHDLALQPQPGLLGGLLATGEHVSVNLLSIALAAKGVSVAALSTDELGLRTEGPPLDAHPVGLELAALCATLESADVVVAPGFIGRNQDGVMNLLGRGGSDITALFISYQLAAECCLVKDVDGLYDGDPNCPNNPAQHHYVRASWDELARVGNVVVQPKAVWFAKTHGIRFRVAAVGRQGTEIGLGPNVFERVAS
jgi:homoserine dehydrogenase